MKHSLTIAIVFALSVGIYGCHGHHHDHDDDPRPGDPKWPVAQVSVFEGSPVTVTLQLESPSTIPSPITLVSADPSRVEVPASVTFPPGTTSMLLTFTTHADADSVDTLVIVTASSAADSDDLGVVLKELPAAPIGPAIGPVAAGPNRALLVDAGIDLIWSTADDELVIANGVGLGTPSPIFVTVGAVTPGPQALPVLTGVADSVLVMTNGPDMTLGTTDDTLVQVSGISTLAPSVTSSLVVGRMEASEGRRPVMVGTSAVFLDRGADLLTSGDDALVAVTGIGTAVLSMTSFPTPGVAFEAPSLVAPMDASTVAIHLSGVDLLFGTADDVLEVITGIGGAPAVGFSTADFFADGWMGVPVVVNPTTLAVVGTGPDLAMGTVDDVVAVIRDILTVPASTSWIIGFIQTDVDAISVVTPGDAWVVPLLGADTLDFTSDDQVAVFTNISTTPLAAPALLAAGNAVPGAKGRLLVLSGTVAIREESGTDGILGTGDDGITVLSSLTGAPASSTIATGALQPFAPLVESSTSAVVVGEGADAMSGTFDDEVTRITGIGSTSALTTSFPGSFRLSGPAALVADGAGFDLLARTAGSDGAPGTADDLLSTVILP